MLQDEKLDEELDHKGFNTKLKDPRCDHNLTLINNQQLRIYLIYHNTYPFFVRWRSQSWQYGTLEARILP
jgi:hypothetical protein